uniref:Tyrosinase copper-binding domain-containing protein n=1 Tax=Echeneis naucrates TaxID=173247 RepID=A0A665VKL7_ECHNA
MLSSVHWLWLVLWLHLTSLEDVEAQFPIPCTRQEALDSRTCCPVWNGSPCGQTAGRGYCAQHFLEGGDLPIDYRVDWPNSFYNKVCACYGNFDGFDCGVCSPGWQGPDCLEPHRVDRKEITDMYEDERELFISNLDHAKHTISNRYKILTSNDTTKAGNFKFHEATVYDLYVWLHYYAAKKYADTDDDAAHRGPAFPFWHRIFLLFIEREIRLLTGNHNFFIPYWDWTRTDHCNICTNDYFGAVDPDGHIDQGSRFSKWKVRSPSCLLMICSRPDDPSPAPISRKPGKDRSADTLPTSGDVRRTVCEDNYDTPPFNKMSKHSFRSRLEVSAPELQQFSAMHNLVHDYFNGTMSHLPTAANDPLFMVHHSFVDKLLEVWLERHRYASYPESDEIHKAQRKESYMAPFFPLRTNGYYWNRSILSLGYKYIEHSIPHPGAVHIGEVYHQSPYCLWREAEGTDHLKLVRAHHSCTLSNPD